MDIPSLVVPDADYGSCMKLTRRRRDLASNPSFSSS